MPTVLITRPREAAESLAAELERLRYQTVLEPLLLIKKLSVPRPAGAADAVMITSSNTLGTFAVQEKELADLFDKPCFCVGPRTAARASNFGFRQVQNTDGDGAELGRMAINALKPGSTILHLSGKHVEPAAHEGLEQGGHRVILWPVYEAVPVDTLSPRTYRLMEEQKLEAVVVFSSRTAETLAELIARAGLRTCCAQIAAICLSEPVAKILEPLNWRHLTTASAPTERALIDRLQSVCPVRS